MDLSSKQSEDENKISAKTEMLMALQNLTNPDNTLRRLAEEKIPQLELTEDYPIHLYELIMNENDNFRHIASIALKSYVKKHWTNNDVATERIKQTLRQRIVNALYHPPPSIRRPVGQIIACIAGTDWPDVWTEFSNIIIECLRIDENTIDVALCVLENFSYNEKKIKKSDAIISEIVNVFESEQISVGNRTRVIKTLRSLLVSINANIRGRKEKNSMINSVLNKFMDKLLYYFSLSCDDTSNFELKAEIVEFLTFLVTEFPKQIQTLIKRVWNIIMEQLTEMVAIYAKDTLNRTEDIDQHNGDIYKYNNYITEIMVLIQDVIEVEEFQNIVDTALTELIYIIIIYMQLPKKIEEDWKRSPKKYISYKLVVSKNQALDIRELGEELLENLKNIFDRKALKALQEAMERHIKECTNEQSSNNPNWWRIQEACFVALHSFSEDIIKSKHKFDLFPYLTLIHNSLELQECPHLVDRALTILSTFSQSKDFRPQMLKKCLEDLLNYLKTTNKSVFLRISAIRSFYNFLRDFEKFNVEKRTLIQEKFPEFLDDTMILLPGSNFFVAINKFETLVINQILETLTAIVKYDPDFALQSKDKLITLAIAVFLEHARDSFIFSTVRDLMKVLCQSGHNCLQSLQDKFIPIVVSIIKLQGEDNQNNPLKEYVIEILNTIVEHSQSPLSGVLIDSAFPAMINCVLRSNDREIIIHGAICFRAFTLTSFEEICSHNSDGLKNIMMMIEKLINFLSDEQTLVEHKYNHLMINITIRTILFKINNNKLKDYITILLKTIINKMLLVKSLDVTKSLMVIFAYILLKQTDAVMKFFSIDSLLVFVLNKWIVIQKSIFGTYERKVTIMGLCKLFEYCLTTQDDRLTSINITDKSLECNESNENVLPFVKIFKLLIKELVRLKESKMTDYNEAEDKFLDDNSKSISKHLTTDIDHANTELFFKSDNNDEVDLLIEELLKDPLLQVDVMEILTEFFKKFSANKQLFNIFISHLSEEEKYDLEYLEINIA